LQATGSGKNPRGFFVCHLIFLISHLRPAVLSDAVNILREYSAQMIVLPNDLDKQCGFHNSTPV
jgi:hypothetical protein